MRRAARALMVVQQWCGQTQCSGQAVWPDLGLQLRGLKTITDIATSRQQSSVRVFDGELKALHRDRAALAALQEFQPSVTTDVSPAGQKKLSYRHDPLLCSVADRLLDRLEDCKSTFKRAAIIGGAALQVLDRLAGGRGGVEEVTVIDSSPTMLQLIQEAAAARALDPAAKPWPRVHCLGMDASAEVLPVDPASFDVVISCLGLHWINDLPTFMAQCRFALRDDGLFLSAMFSGQTLQELRIACSVAQMDREGGVSPFVSPLAQMRDGGNLLTLAGLAIPSVDTDDFVLRYPGGAPELVAHLRVLGEVNAVAQRQVILKRDTALAAASAYQSMFGSPEDNSIPATFQIMYLTGWAPHDSQQKPARRGSASVTFQDLADGLVSAGDAQGGSTGEGTIGGGN